MNAFPNPPRAVFLLLWVAVIASACGSTPAVADPAAVPLPSAASRSPEVALPDPSIGTPEPSSAPPVPPATPAPSRTPDRDAVPDRSAEPDPSPPPAPTVWSKARVVLSPNCWNPAAAIDEAGAIHVAAACRTRIRYATSKDGKEWRTATFSRPAHRLEVEPQVAVDGSTLYVAFTRLRETDGGCGDSGLEDLGVYYRSRTLPSGRWSRPVRLGAAGDRLQSFRVVDGVIHETYIAHDGQGPVSYGSLSRGSFRSVKIPGALQTSLRVGDDGRARIAYTTGDSMRYAVARRDGRLPTRTIFKSDDMQLTAPSLVLGAGNRAYLAWNAHEPWGGGCTDGAESVSKPGTYFGTDATGTWRVRRISKVVAAPSLTLDISTGRLYVALATDGGVREMTRLANGRWSGTRIPRSRHLDQLVVRRDGVTGHLLLVGIRWSEGSDTVEIVALVKS
jgi:hypothetical protein